MSDDKTRAALASALTDAYKRGYREGGQDALGAAANAFDAEAHPGVADALRRMLTISAKVLADD